ncbi:MAG: PAS domain S-box protein [Lautropia sp.]
MNPQAPAVHASFFLNLGIPAAILDAEFGFLFVNPAFEQRFGYLANELVGQNVLRIYDPSAADTVRSNCELLSSLDSATMNGERHLIDRSGRRFDAIVHTAKYLVEGSIFYAVVYQDMKESRERERLLVSRAEMFRLTIEQSPVPISIQDQNWRLVLVNRAYCQLMGYDESELLGRDPLEFLHSEVARSEVPRQREALRRSNLDELPRFSSIREARHRDGRLVHYQLELGYTKGIDGAPLWCSILIDLSKIHQTRSDLDRQVALSKQLLTRFQAFAASLDEAVVVVAPGTDAIVYASPATLEVFGLTPDRLVGEPVSCLWRATDAASRSALEDGYRQLARSHSAARDAVVTGADGASRTLRVRFMRSEEIAPEYFVLAEDVTVDRRLQKERLNEAIAQREAIIREVHHRIKNNLQGAAGLLQRAADRRPECRDEMLEVADQIHTIAEIHGLQIRSGLLVQVQDVAVVIRDHLSSHFGRSVQCASIRKGDGTRWQLSEVQAVPVALVFNEMLTNAIKHSPPDSPIELAIDERDGELRIVVRNRIARARPDGQVFNGAPHGGIEMMRTLLPMRGVALHFDAEDGVATCTLRLWPPAIAAAGEAVAGTQGSAHAEALRPR